jgi:hypothetical protein
VTLPTQKDQISVSLALWGLIAASDPPTQPLALQEPTAQPSVAAALRLVLLALWDTTASREQSPRMPALQEPTSALSVQALSISARSVPSDTTAQLLLFNPWTVLPGPTPTPSVSPTVCYVPLVMLVHTARQGLEPQPSALLGITVPMSGDNPPTTAASVLLAISVHWDQLPLLTALQAPIKTLMALTCKLSVSSAQ